MKSRYLIAGTIAIAGVVVLLGTCRQWLGGTDQIQGVAESAKAVKPDSETTRNRRVPGENEVEIGGVVRPRRDVVGPQRDPRGFSDRPIFNIGQSPLINTRENVYTRSVLEAATDPTGELAYRLTPFVPAPKFNREEYLKNPDAYLNEVVPGRVFDVLPYSEDNPRIQRASDSHQTVLQGESVILRAETEPAMPVSFYSTRLGRFNGGLSTITVAANEDGIAEVSFETTGGMFGEAEIVATSPVRSGKLRYFVDVRLPSSGIR